MARLATVLANLFEDSEYTEPKKALEAKQDMKSSHRYESR